ncbi:cytochrome P450 [Saccharothrix obliqua]|uniref:cytochrome P450 n=1 Tax=Saccharothrix obliqua TaxID=2861747 RepID=UPI001C5FD454|nr:cytochrome P450 [Saccharothrix obliqua]MBW4718162.1 cytochrome P450 [Saccharothrix obliqua]
MVDPIHVPSTRNLVSTAGLRGVAHHVVEDGLRDRGQWITPAALPNGVRVLVATVPLETAKALLADPRLSKDSADLTAALRAQGVAEEEVNGMFAPSVLMSNPPTHGRLRGLISTAFAPRRVRALRSRVERIAAELVAALPVDEPVDLMDRLASPLPLIVISELLGLPRSDHDRLRAWTDALMAESPDVSPQATRDMTAYMAEAIEHKRRHPDDGLLSALVQVGVDGDRLTPEELLGNAFILVVAGHETTANAIGNALALLLAADAAGWREVVAHPEEIPRVVDEALRVDNGVRNAPHRVATEDFDVLGATVRAGELVLINIGAANRDPAVHGADAALFRPARATAAQHISFGHGVHYCLGAQLARLEVNTVLRELSTRHPRARLAVQAPRRRDSSIMNPYAALPVVLPS